MTSNERNFINGLWRQLGIDPRSDAAREIEARITRAALQEIADGFKDLAASYLSKQKA